VLIGSLTCHVKPEHESEFLASAGTLLERARRFNGCLACRIVAEHPYSRSYVLITEWADRATFDRFVSSREFHILRGMQILMRDEYCLVVDDVLSRAEMWM
jgi:quinol monooxygenase YgiN